jgi:hypothetical protein
MRTPHLDLQLEKLEVLRDIVQEVKIDNDDLTRDMLLKLRSKIDSLLESDF